MAWSKISRAAVVILLFVVFIRNDLFSLNPSFYLSLDTLSNNQKSALPVAYDPSVKAHLPRCRMLIYNKPDWHYEILESIAIRYPIPWEWVKCSTSEPLLVDYQVSRATHKPGWLEGNDVVESSGFTRYYKGYLQGTVRSRADGLSIQFGSIGPVSSNNSHYHVVIDASMCNNLKDERFYCVGHVQCDFMKQCKESPESRRKTCWLNPMHDCFFLARDLPQFPAKKVEPGDKIIGCTSGGLKDLARLGKGLQALNKPEDLEIRYFSRYFEIPENVVKAVRALRREGVEDMVKLIAELDFVLYQRKISECDFYMTLLNPSTPAAGYYPGNGSKLSGGISQAIAYQFPMVIHQELHDIYGPHLSATSMGYRDTEQFKKALANMMKYLRKERNKAMTN